jgi:Zn-dependent protease/predicted transcriptional regulator
MFRNGIPIGKAFGIALRLDYSWFIIFVLITWSLAVYFPSAQIWGTVYTFNTTVSIIMGIVTSLLFFGSVLAHELMHSIVAQREGIPVKSITLFVLGGVSEITEEPRKPTDEFRMAFAGPLTSIVLGIIFLGISLIAVLPDYIKAPAYYLGYINILLGVFNLIPGFPLDGGRVLRSIIWWKNNDLKKATRIAAGIGQAIGYIFIIGGIFIIFISLNNLITGLWTVFIGWFLQSSAANSYRQLALQEMLKGHKASEIMTMDCSVVSPSLSVDRLVSENVLAQSKRCFPVVQGDKVEGLVTLHNIQAVPREQWTTKSVGQIMTTLDQMKSVKPDTELEDVFKIITGSNINQLPVIVNGNIVGMITRENLLNFINVRSELYK